MSGLGDDIRGLIIVLDRLCIPYSVVCLGHPSDHLMYGRVPNEVLKPVYASSIFCMNGFEFCKLSDIYKNLSDNYGYIVLQAPWELPKLVAKWGPKLEVVDKIWAISKFVETAFTSADFDNVVYNPPIVDVFTPSISNKIRRQKRPFTFLYVFDAASYLSRKNPQAAVQCFQKAFQSDENVCLILKVSNAESSAEFAELERKCLSDKRIHVKRQSLKPEQIVKMINQCSCYLSLHRSEGFGRTIAQASLLAKPVIATNWSGSTDILPDNCRLNVAYTLIAVKEGEYPGFEQQHWAEPDEAVAIEKMKEIYFATDALRLKTGLENQKFAQERFTPEASVERYHEQFKYIMGHTEDQ
jgi:glycosyltransferase involved in cell wall biosynthesis